MAISPDPLSVTVGTLTERSTQLTQKLSDIRRGNWLLSLEREQLASKRPYQSSDTQTSNAVSDSMGDSGEEDSLVGHTKQDAMSSQTSLSRPKQMSSPVHTGQAISIATIAGYQTQIEMKSGVSPLGMGLNQNNAYTRSAFKDEPSLKLNELAMTEMNSAVELEIMGVDSAAVVAANEGQLADAYSLRQIHLYSHDGKVQAWIRDAQLDEKRSSALEAALRNDLKKSGWELVGLAINGKKTASLLQKSQQRLQLENVINA